MQKHTSKNAEKHWHIRKNQQSQWIAGFAFLAGDEGFEPPQTESESGVLPLHKSPMCLALKRMYYYMHLRENVKTKITVFAKNKLWSRSRCLTHTCVKNCIFSPLLCIFSIRVRLRPHRTALGRKRAGNHAEYC